MAKSFGLIFLVVMGSSQLFAASTTVGVVDEQTGDLIIQILDDPGSASPYDAAQLWNAMKGTENKKVLTTDTISIKCDSLVAEPQKYRFGSCTIEVKAQKVANQEDGFGALIGGSDAQKLLTGFVGSEDANFPLVKNLKLANGKFLITADHQREIFALIIKNELMH